MNDTDKHKLQQPELEADIYYLNEQEGGRKTAVPNGYRGQFYYDNGDWDAIQQFIGKEWCQPGDTVKVLLKTIRPNFHYGKFYVGKEFEIREGAIVVGKGKVTKVLRPDFNFRDTETSSK